MREFMHGRNSTPSLAGGIRAMRVQSLKLFFAARATPSCAFVSRSRALLYGESAIAPEVMKLFQSLHSCSVTTAICTVYVSQDGDQRKATAKLVHDTVRLSKSMLTKDSKYPCELLHGKCTVAFCAVSGDSWFVAVAAEGPRLTHDIIRSIGILRLRETDEAKDSAILFNCYAVANYSGRTECEALAKCLGNSFYRWYDDPMPTPWTARANGKSHYRIHTIAPTAMVAMPAVVYVIASENDWSELERRHVDFHGRTKEIQYAQHFDVTSPSTTCFDCKTIILIGGESGSGKTMHMVTGNRREADVVVYVRCVLPAVPDDKEPEEIKEVITRVRESMSVVIAVNNQCSTKPNDNAANRDNLFLDILVDLVKLAMRNANPELHDALQKWGVGNDIKKVVFRVRLCLDEIGASTAFIHACCATRPDKLRDLLGWGTRVELRIIAGGTGVSNSESLDFADSLRFKYSVFSERGIKLYWSMRDSLDRLLDDKFEDLREARKRLKKAWANVEERKDALKNRDVALQACIKRASNENSQENGEQQWNTMGIEEDHASQRRLILEALFSAVESDEACGAALANPRLAALIVAQCKRVADGLVQTELCTLTSGTNIRQKILDPVAQSFKEITGLKLASPRIANRLLVESLRHAVFSGYKVGAESHDSITTDALMTSWGVLVDNLVYKPEPPGDGFERVLKRNVNALFDNEKVTLYKCFDKTVGRYSISPAMLVVLHALMADAFDDTFTTIGDVFAEAMAKFLFVAAQVFCGRPVSELVDFVIGPKAIVGNNVANKCTKTIPTVLVRLRQCNDANAVWSGTSDEDELRRNAFVDISPVNLPSADVVLHIPGTITLAVKCKDVGKLSPNEIRDAFSIMDFSPKESHKFEVANPNAVNYPKKLMELEAPVISIVYTSRTLFSVNDDDISERFDAVGPNCILAQGIGEVTEQVASSSPVEVPPMQWDDFRLSNIRRNLLQFDARRRHVDGEKSFDIAVSEGTEPNTAANNAARYARGSSREFTFASELAVVDEGKKFAKERCESPVKDDGLG